MATPSSTRRSVRGRVVRAPKHTIPAPSTMMVPAPTARKAGSGSAAPPHGSRTPCGSWPPTRSPPATRATASSTGKIRAKRSARASRCASVAESWLPSGAMVLIFHLSRMDVGIDEGGGFSGGVRIRHGHDELLVEARLHDQGRAAAHDEAHRPAVHAVAPAAVVHGPDVLDGCGTDFLPLQRH